MKILFTPDAWDDCLWWQQNDRAVLKRVSKLIEDICRNGYEGIGKPEALRQNLAGFWSRRITSEHRIVYMIEDDTAKIVACRHHYE